MSDELSPAAKALIAGAKSAPGLGAARRARVTAGVLGATTGTGLAAAATTTAATTTAATTTAASTATGGASLLKLVGVGLIASLVGAAGTTAIVELSRPPAAPKRAAPTVVARPLSGAPRVAAPPPPAPPAPLALVAADAPVEQPRPPPPAAVAPQVVRRLAPQPEPKALPEFPPPAPRTASSETAAADSSAEELLALSATLDALDQGRLDEALSLAQRATKAHPNGVLRPELKLAEVLALCALGRPEEAKAITRAMSSSDRTALVLQKLRGSCAPP